VKTAKNGSLFATSLFLIFDGASMYCMGLHHDDHIELLEHCSMRIEYEKKQALDNVRILALATHLRLGSDSPLAILDQDSWRTLCQSIIESELQEIAPAKLQIKSFRSTLIFPEPDMS